MARCFCFQLIFDVALCEQHCFQNRNAVAWLVQSVVERFDVASLTQRDAIASVSLEHVVAFHNAANGNPDSDGSFRRVPV